jgi:hypothetical protein
MVHRIGTVRSNLHLEYGVRAFAENSLDRDPNRSQVFSETAVVHREINEFAQPM